MNQRADFANLDVLRSLAVLFVVFSHLPAILALADPSVYPFRIVGLLGVLIFFVHTCLVLMFSLERQYASDGRSGLIGAFLIRRVFRIYPLSISVVVVLVAIRFASSNGVAFPVVLSNILLIQNITKSESIPGALWSLPFEMQMYVVLPFLFLFVTRFRQSQYFLFAAWLVAVAFILSLWRAGIDYTLFKYIPCFLPGVIAFSFMRKGLPPSVKPIWLFLAVGVVAAIYPLCVAHGLKENLLAWPICLALGVSLPWICQIENAFLRGWGKRIAKYSYGIYLLHMPCIDFSFHTLSGIPEIARWIIFVGMVSGLSYLVYHYIEQPMINIGVSIANRFAKRSADSRNEYAAL